MKTYPLYLNGEFVTSEPAWDVVNPATGEAFAKISTIDRRRLAQALADAHAAFAGWRQITAKARGEYLRRIASELERRRRSEDHTSVFRSMARRRLAQALADAHAAFAGWRQITAKARGEYLRRIASELERRRDEI